LELVEHEAVSEKFGRIGVGLLLIFAMECLEPFLE